MENSATTFNECNEVGIIKENLWSVENSETTFEDMIITTSWKKSKGWNFNEGF